MARLPLQTNARAGTFALISAYRTAAGLDLGQVYRARPTRIKVPSVYIDRITESTDGFTIEERQRTVRVYVRCVWGVYDGGDTVDQRDRFVDGFYAYVADNGRDSFGANADAVRWVGVEDDENFQADWIDTSRSRSAPPSNEPLYMTEITLEGFAST